MTGAQMIAVERQRQIDVECWTPQHDAEHSAGTLAWAAVAYAAPQTVYRLSRTLRGLTFVDPWPWAIDKRRTTGSKVDNDGEVKLTSADRIRELVKAGALIAAEIDRLTPSIRDNEAV